MVRVDIFGIAVFLFFLPQFSSFGASTKIGTLSVS